MNRAKLTPEDEAFLRNRFPRASYWVFGTDLSERERSAALLGGGPGYRRLNRGGRSWRGLVPKPRGGSYSTLPVHEPTSLSHTRQHVGEVSPVPAVPINASTNLFSSKSDTLPDHYLGPCWDCIAESSFHIAHGGDETASNILGSCRHRRPSSPSSLNLLHPNPPNSHTASLLASGIPLLLIRVFLLCFLGKWLPNPCPPKKVPRLPDPNPPVLLRPYGGGMNGCRARCSLLTP